LITFFARNIRTEAVRQGSFSILVFLLDNWSALAEALRQHGLENNIVNAIESPFGCRYIVEGKIMSPDGRNPSVRTVWIVEKGESAPHLITAHPA